MQELGKDIRDVFDNKNFQGNCSEQELISVLTQLGDKMDAKQVEAIL